MSNLLLLVKNSKHFNANFKDVKCDFSLEEIKFFLLLHNCGQKGTVDLKDLFDDLYGAATKRDMKMFKGKLNRHRI